MNLPQYDAEIRIDIRPDAPILVDEVPTDLHHLVKAIEKGAEGKRAKLTVYVRPPSDKSPAFLDHVRAVQAELRKTKEPVVVAYHSVAA